jgi:thioredoxin-related protein
MRRLIVAMAVLATVLLAGTPADLDPAKDLVKHASVIPYTGKPIMLMFDSSTCPYCKQTRKDLVNDTYLNSVAVNFDLYNIPRDEPQKYTVLGNETTAQTLQMLYKVKVTPNIILLSSKGEKIWQLPGYAKPEVLGKIMAFVLGVDNGTYKKAEWKEYLKKNGLI